MIMKREIDSGDDSDNEQDEFQINTYKKRQSLEDVIDLEDLQLNELL